MTTNTVLITGANRGIGLGLTQAYCHAGWRVLAICRSLHQAADLKILAAEAPDRLHLFECDLKNEAAIKALGSKLAKESIDILYNNAAILLDRKDGHPSLKHSDLSFAPLMESFQVNAVAPLILSQTLLASILSSKLKIIVNLNSTLGSISTNEAGTFHAGAIYYYRSSKAALNALTRTMALELKDLGVTVLSLSPGWVKTEMGGPGAELTVEESVACIQKLIAGLSLADSGKFLSHEGEELPW